MPVPLTRHLTWLGKTLLVRTFKFSISSDVGTWAKTHLVVMSVIYNFHAQSMFWLFVLLALQSREYDSWGKLISAEWQQGRGSIGTHWLSTVATFSLVSVLVCAASVPSLCYHCTITLPSLCHHITITVPSLSHHWAITMLLLYYHCTITVPSLCYHFAITVLSLCHHCAITVFGCPCSIEFLRRGVYQMYM